MTTPGTESGLQLRSTIKQENVRIPVQPNDRADRPLVSAAGRAAHAGRPHTVAGAAVVQRAVPTASL